MPGTTDVPVPVTVASPFGQVCAVQVWQPEPSTAPQSVTYTGSACGTTSTPCSVGLDGPSLGSLGLGLVVLIVLVTAVLTTRLRSR